MQNVSEKLRMRMLHYESRNQTTRMLLKLILKLLLRSLLARSELPGMSIQVNVD